MEKDTNFNPAEVRRAVFGLRSQVMHEGYYHPPHSHSKAQLIYTTRGMVTCQVAKGLWMVPPQSALWIPGGMEHSLRGTGIVEIHILFLDSGIRPGLPQDCCTVTVSPLLRELVTEVASWPLAYGEDGETENLIAVLLDRLSAAAVQELHLPMPSDARLRKLVSAVQARPADRASTREWAQRVGLSERTLFRMILDETGMSFGRWRQQIQLMFALEHLAEGVPVQTIAMDLGYESPSAFITMFKKALGQPPARYRASKTMKSGL